MESQQGNQHEGPCTKGCWVKLDQERETHTHGMKENHMEIGLGGHTKGMGA